MTSHSHNTNHTIHTHSHIHISITVPGVIVINIVLSGSVELSVVSCAVNELETMVDVVLGII